MDWKILLLTFYLHEAFTVITLPDVSTKVANRPHGIVDDDVLKEVYGPLLTTLTTRRSKPKAAKPKTKSNEEVTEESKFATEKPAEKSGDKTEDEDFPSVENDPIDRNEKKNISKNNEPKKNETRDDRHDNDDSKEDDSNSTEYIDYNHAMYNDETDLVGPYRFPTLAHDHPYDPLHRKHTLKCYHCVDFECLLKITRLDTRTCPKGVKTCQKITGDVDGRHHEMRMCGSPNLDYYKYGDQCKETKIPRLVGINNFTGTFCTCLNSFCNLGDKGVQVSLTLLILLILVQIIYFYLTYKHFTVQFVVPQSQGL